MPRERTTIRIRGQSFAIQQRRKVVVDGKEMDGACDPPDRTRRSIYYRSDLPPDRKLDVLIHEMLHAAFWDMSEEAIDETATDIANALLQLGYRPPKLQGHAPND